MKTLNRNNQSRASYGRGLRLQVIDPESLQDQGCKSAFHNCFDALQSLDCATDWNAFKEETLEVPKLTFGTHPRSVRSSISTETLVVDNERQKIAQRVGEKMQGSISG